VTRMHAKRRRGELRGSRVRVSADRQIGRDRVRFFAAGWGVVVDAYDCLGRAKLRRSVPHGLGTRWLSDVRDLVV
jgi:hypothetical protein